MAIKTRACVLEVAGKVLETTADGFLVDRDAWTRDVARAMAAADGVAMTDQHWEIIEFLRDYYHEYRIIPIMRVLAKAIARRLGDDKGNSRYPVIPPGASAPGIPLCGPA